MSANPTKPRTQKDPTTGETHHWCNQCDAYLPEDRFYPANRGKGPRLCKTHNRAAAAPYIKAWHKLHRRPDTRKHRKRVDPRKHRKRKRPPPPLNSVARIHLNTNAWLKRNGYATVPITVSRDAMRGIDLETEQRYVCLRPKHDQTQPIQLAVQFKHRKIGSGEREDGTSSINTPPVN